MLQKKKKNTRFLEKKIQYNIKYILVLLLVHFYLIDVHNTGFLHDFTNAI